jgi:hypothetical protein
MEEDEEVRSRPRGWTRRTDCRTWAAARQGPGTSLRRRTFRLGGRRRRCGRTDAAAGCVR